MAEYSKLSDPELLNLLKEGDHLAFNQIYKRYSKPLLDSVYRRLDSIEEAEELVQELFINLYIRRAEIVIVSSLEMFLKSALKYRVLNIFRTRMTRERYVAIMQKDEQIDTADPHHHLQAKELALKIKAATQKLPKKCREVFILSKIEHLSNKSIAEKLGISISTVEQHITKAMKLMRDDFKTYDQGLVLILFILYFN